MSTPTHGAAPGGAVPAQQRGTKENPIESRAASLQPSTFDSVNRTVDVVASTGARVRRYDWWRDEYYDEVLLVSPDAVDLTRFEQGAVPVLNSHQQWDLRSTIGTTLPGTARFEGSDLILTAKMSARQEIAGIVQDIADGITRNVSVGYKILAYEVDETTNPKTRTITKWELLELSFVPVGADGGAGTRALPTEPPDQRSADLPAGTSPNTQTINLTIDTAGMSAALEQAVSRAVAAHPTQPVSNGERTMADTNTPAPGVSTDAPQPGTESRAVSPAAPPAVNSAAEIEATRAAESARIQGIRDIAVVRSFGVSNEVLDEAIRSGMSIDAFRTKVMDSLAQREQAEQPETRSNITVLQDEGQTRADAAVRALLNRSNPSKYKLDGAAVEYRGIKLINLAREVLESHGTRVRGMADKEIAIRALQTTSDFPHILSGVANTSLRAGYQMAPRTFMAWARQTMATDFKDMHQVQFGGGGVLPKVGEHGEFQRGKLYESKESFRVATYGEIVAITRQVIVNDQLDALTRIPQEHGFRAAVTENSVVYGVLLANPVMSDGKALFHAGHGNLAASGTALSLASLSAGRSSMRKVKALDGKTIINAQPAILLVPAALETKAEQLIVTRSMVAATAGEQIPEFFRSLEPVVEPLLDADSQTAHYLFTDPASPTGSITYAYLEGEEGVYTEERIGFDVDGMEIKVRHDFGAGVMDYRGVYKDPGAAPA
ncbi:hypothetical protein J2847_005885 [Azospirillum agricola]|uniref:prohead protease/major capsid protein fusion protein n=1 Tax=Azospirillum agricola TaxID=1720247 RepID=UPI001AE975DF|nr:prohead protease/major capsid protein fusion protein [Azospirillum agricola]MBP2232556.1 hypothetical protein [Azospirillum agricola]